jgi:hypothetical protein
MSSPFVATEYPRLRGKRVVGPIPTANHASDHGLTRWLRIFRSFVTVAEIVAEDLDRARFGISPRSLIGKQCIVSVQFV